jgi:hypothetical protein
MGTFPIEKSLHAEKVWIGEVIFPGYIMLKKQSLFVTAESNDTMLYQYALPEFKCIYKGGVKGQAEDEFQDYPAFCHTTSDKIFICGYTRFTIKSFTMNDDYRLSFEKEYKLPVSGDEHNDMYVVGDSILIYKPDEMVIKKVNLNTQQEMGQIFFKPDDYQEITFYSNRGYMAVNDSMIVYAYVYKKQIDFYNVDDMKLCKRLVDDDVIPHIVVGDFKNSFYCCHGLVAGKNYFYVKCPGNGGNMHIEVYDYSGHSVAKYELDIALQEFEVDEQNRIIYGYNTDLFEDYFLRYSF